MLCQRLKSCTPNICLQRGWVYFFYCVHFLRCFVLYHYILVFYLFNSRLLFRFPFFFLNYKHFFATIHLYYVHFSHCLCWFVLFYSLSLSFCSLFLQFPLVVWVSILFFFVNTSLQQSTCIVFISHIVGFALPCCLLLFFCSLLDHFPCCCLGFWFFRFFKKKLQQST